MMLVVVVLLLSLEYCAGEKCLSGIYHKNVSSPGGANFVECLGYKKNSCCKASLTNVIKNHPERLYNFTWHHCRAVSQRCQRYLKNEECFYQCEPTLLGYLRPKRADVVQNVPICPSYCDKWFEACKDDTTCAENWETDFVIVGGKYACRNASKCRTYSQVYKNGAGLCNKMWGVSFSYNSSGGKCYTMGPDANAVGSAVAMQAMMLAVVMAMFTALVFGS